MRERDVERRLVRMVLDLGGFAPKLSCPGMDGMPDRLILLPGGRVAFAEIKAPGKRPAAAAQAPAGSIGLPGVRD